MKRHLHSSLPGLLLLCLLVCAPAQALEVKDRRHSLGTEVEFLEEPSGELTLEQLLAEPARYRFSHSSDHSPKGSFTPIWVKLELHFSEQSRQNLYYLFARVENLYEIRIYRPDNTGRYSEYVTGNNYPASSREIIAPRYGFLVEPNAESMTLYLRFIGGPGSTQFPWDLVEKHTYDVNADLYYGFDVACLAAIGALLIFNSFIALSLRRPEYIFYCAYVFSVMMALLTLDGIAFYYLWPDFPAFNNRALHSFNLFSAGMRLLTIASFLGLAGFAPRMHRLALGILGLLAITFLLVNAVGVSGLPPYAATVPWAIGILYGFVICIHAIRKKIPLAVPLLITLAVPSAAAVTQALLTINGSNPGILEMQLAKIGFVFHILLFSLCLATHIRQETQSRILALHDSLTGLPGTTLLQERFDLASQFSVRQGSKMAVCFIDLDGFKAVNDKFGHAVGDQLLIEVGRRLQKQLRSSDTVARIGGDEFVVLLTQVQEISAVHRVAQQLLASIAEPFQLETTEARVSGSIGIAIHPCDGTDLQTLLKVADSGMYAAKNDGKNAYTVADPDRPETPAPVWRFAGRPAA